MKIWNRFISFALATTLLLTVPLVSFAAGTKNSTSSDFTTVQSASGELLVRAYDLDNGDSVFEQYNDGKLVSRYTVDRSKNVINELVYSSDGTSKQLQRFIPTEKNFDIVLPQSTMSRRLGRIRFQYTDGTGTGICGAYVDYVKETGNKKYDINGTYRDLAGLASVVAGALSLPAAPALAISKTALAYFGFAMTAVQFTIPQCNLNSQYEQIEYTLTDINHFSHKNSFWGTKYVITESGNKFNNTYTDGEYYPTTSWGNQNFGMTIYNYLFTYSNWNIYAWN